MSDIQEEEPLYSYKRISRPSVKTSDQNFLNLLTLQTIDNLFNISYEDIERIYQRCFFKKTTSFNVILGVFTELSLLKIINYFSVHTVISHNKKLGDATKHIAEQMRLEINSLYKKILSKIKNQEIGCFSLSLFIGFFVSYYLIKFQFFDKQSDNINFLCYCVEIVHMRLNGFSLNSNTLFKHICDMFLQFYTMKAKKRSMINLSLPKSQFEQEISNKISFQNSSQYKSIFDLENRDYLHVLEERFSKMHKNYQEVTDDFIKIIKDYIETQQNYEDYAVIRKKPVINRQSLTNKPNTLDIHGLGMAIRNNTHNPKKQCLMRFENVHKKTQSLVQLNPNLFRDDLTKENNIHIIENSKGVDLKEKDHFRISNRKFTNPHNTISNNIMEKFEVLNSFEKKIKAMDFKLEKIQKSSFVANTLEPRREIKFQSINADFQIYTDFYNQMKQNKETGRSHKVFKEEAYKCATRDNNHISNQKLNTNRIQENYANKGHSRKVFESAANRRSLPALENVKSRGFYTKQMNTILQANPQC
jgi:hypothetical protein